jgi:homopolymeric O-antigen transport system permease protein
MKADVSPPSSNQLTSHAGSRLGDFVSMPRFLYLRDLLITLVGRDIKLRYKRSILGVAWSLLTPLAQLTVYYITFDVLLPLSVPNYLAFLFSGVLVWNWFQGSLYQATSTIVENRELIKRPNFPVAILPAVTVASYLIHFLLALPVLFFVLLAGGIRMTSAIVALPLVIVIQFVMTLSIAYFTATFYVTFRDTQHLLGVLLNLLFFLSPIFYNSNDLPAKYQAFYRLNPMVHLMEAYRAILLSGDPPNVTSLLILSIPTIVVLFCGYCLFRRASDHFVDEL